MDYHVGGLSQASSITQVDHRTQRSIADDLKQPATGTHQQGCWTEEKRKREGHSTRKCFPLPTRGHTKDFSALHLKKNQLKHAYTIHRNADKFWRRSRIKYTENMRIKHGTNWSIRGGANVQHARMRATALQHCVR